MRSAPLLPPLPLPLSPPPPPCSGLSPTAGAAAGPLPARARAQGLVGRGAVRTPVVAPVMCAPGERSDKAKSEGLGCCRWLRLIGGPASCSHNGATPLCGAPMSPMPLLPVGPRPPAAAAAARGEREGEFGVTRAASSGASCVAWSARSTWSGEGGTAGLCSGTTWLGMRAGGGSSRLKGATGAAVAAMGDGNVVTVLMALAGCWWVLGPE